jgi:DNA-binding transcriptional regulator YhcF (GntR family)
MQKIIISESSDKAIYIQLKNKIKEDILIGKYPPLSKLPPVSKIATASGVSLRTADCALQELINEGICFRRPKKGTFVSDIPKVLTQDTCGLLTSISNMSTSESSLLYHGVMAAAMNNSICAFTIPLPVEDKSSTPSDIIKMFDQGSNFSMKGVFIITKFFNYESLEIARNFPDKKFFFLNYQGDWLNKMPENMQAVVNDDYTGACNLAQKVIKEYKVKNAMILSRSLGLGDMTYNERVLGIKAAAQSANIPILKEISIESGFSHITGYIQKGYEEVKNFLQNGGETDFIFCINDLLAYGAKMAIEENNLQGKIHVSGYDCLYNQYSKDFPTVKVAYTQMGEIALQQMLSEEKAKEKVIKLLPELINI